MSTKRARVLKFKRGSYLRQHFSKSEIADMHYVFGFCNGDARKAAREYHQRYPQRLQPSFRLFNEIHRRLRKHGIPQKKEPRFRNYQVADMHFLYGFCNGDAHAAVIEYKRRYPTRAAVSHEDFILVHKRVRKHGTREQIEPVPDLEEAEKAKVRPFSKMAYKNPTMRKALLNLGMHPLIMSELLKKGKPNLQLHHFLRSMKKKGYRLSFKDSENESESDESVGESEEDTDFEDSSDCNEDDFEGSDKEEEFEEDVIRKIFKG